MKSRFAAFLLAALVPILAHADPIATEGRIILPTNTPVPGRVLIVPSPGNSQAVEPWWNGMAHPPSVTMQPIAAGASTALEAGHVIKASAGSLFSLTITTSTASGFEMVFDAASVPADGAVTPLYCYAVPAGASFSVQWNNPLVSTTGLVAVFSTTGCLTKTASATAFFSWQNQ